jgi:hypothetical protein
MVVVRNVFRMNFGKAKEATDLWKQALAVLTKLGNASGGVRLLTDLAGPSFYTIVLETSHASITEWEQASQAIRSAPEFKAIYQKISALTDEGHREILTVIG